MTDRPYVLLRCAAEIYGRPPLSEEAARAYFLAVGNTDPEVVGDRLEAWLSAEDHFPLPPELRGPEAA